MSSTDRLGILVMLIMLSSCSPRLMVEQRDSIKTTTETEWRDTTVAAALPDERVTICTPLQDTVTVQTSVAEVTIYKTDTLYKVQLRNRSEIPLLVPVKMPVQKVTTIRSQLIRQKEIVEVEKKVWWKTTLMWTGAIAILLAILKVVRKIYGGRISSVIKASSLVAKLFS